MKQGRPIIHERMIKVAHGDGERIAVHNDHGIKRVSDDWGGIGETCACCDRAAVRFRRVHGSNEYATAPSCGMRDCEAIMSARIPGRMDMRAVRIRMHDSLIPARKDGECMTCRAPVYRGGRCKAHHDEYLEDLKIRNGEGR